MFCFGCRARKHSKMVRKILIVLSVCVVGSLNLELEVVNQWSFFDFNFPYDYDLINGFRYVKIRHFLLFFCLLLKLGQFYFRKKPQTC